MATVIRSNSINNECRREYSDNHGDDEDDKIYIRKMMTRKLSRAPYVIIMREDNREDETWRR